MDPESLRFTPGLVAAVVSLVTVSFFLQGALSLLQFRFLASENSAVDNRSLGLVRERQWLLRKGVDHAMVLLLIPTGLIGEWFLLWNSSVAMPAVAASGALVFAAVAVHCLRCGVAASRPGAVWPDITAAAVAAGALGTWLAVTLGGFLAGWAIWSVALIGWHCVLAGPLRAQGTVIWREYHENRPDLAELMQQVSQPLHRLRVRPAHSMDEPPNAGTAGMGPTTRLVLHENLLRTLRPRAVAAVVAHELGHVMGYHRLIYYGLAALVTLPAFVAPHMSVAGADGSVSAMPAAFVLAGLYLALPLACDWIAPAANALRRRMEFDADRRAAALTSPDAIAAALRTLDRLSGSDRTPQQTLVAWFRAPYPSLAARCQVLDAIRARKCPPGCTKSGSVGSTP